MILASLFSILIYSFYMYPIQAEEVFTEVANYKSCVKVYDGGMQSNAQRVIRFYNGCPVRLYINACVKSREGEVKLYQSGRTVQTNGNFTIYTFPFVEPKTVAYSASPSLAAIPPPCSEAF